jgi:hypothetical protein
MRILCRYTTVVFNGCVIIYVSLLTANCGTTKTIPIPLKSRNYPNALMTSLVSATRVTLGANLVLQQFCAHKPELLRVLDTHQLQGGLPGEASPGNTPPLHTNAAESDIREYVTRRKISGGTRHADGRRARDTFTGLKKTCRKLAYSFWQYLLSRLQGSGSVPYLPDVIRSRATAKAEILSRPLP